MLLQDFTFHDDFTRIALRSVLSSVLRIVSISPEQLWRRHLIDQEQSLGETQGNTDSGVVETGGELVLHTKTLEAIAERSRVSFSSSGSKNQNAAVVEKPVPSTGSTSTLSMDDWTALLERLRNAEDSACVSIAQSSSAASPSRALSAKGAVQTPTLSAQGFVRLFPVSDCGSGYGRNDIAPEHRSQLDVLHGCWQYGKPISLSELFQAGEYGTPGKVSLARKLQNLESSDRDDTSSMSDFARRKEAVLRQERNKLLIAEKQRAKYNDVRQRNFSLCHVYLGLCRLVVSSPFGVCRHPCVVILLTGRSSVVQLGQVTGIR